MAPQDCEVPPPAPTHSSAEDYRSVIDDLTIEIKRLKDELKRYRQSGPSPLRSEKLFELKVHSLPAWKKRELEATLREFASGLETTSNPNASSSPRKKSSRNTSRMYSGSQSGSKQASSSSESQRRPVDSAYASMSTGHASAGTSQGRHSGRSRVKYSEQKVENYLKEIPEGLYPRHITMSEKQKKKLVVRRLEQLFTGKPNSKQRAKHYEVSPMSVPVSENQEPAREARILPSLATNKKGGSRDNGESTSNSNGDQTSLSGSGNGNGNGSGNGPNNSSPPTIPPPEQRPTRPRDLDPDRPQNPSENIEYLRHLGIAPPDIQRTEVGNGKAATLSPDADGWVYLNLLCNLAQLHIFNVTPSFIRAAVSEKSSKFQLSADGRKIRWRGGTEGTKFSSDSSGDNSCNSKSPDDSSSPNDGGSGNNKFDGEQGWATAHKRSKSKTSGIKTSSGPSAARQTSKTGPQTSSEEAAAASFQYKPLFFKHRTSNEQTSEDTGSSPESREESYFTGSGWDASHSMSSTRRKRRADGAIIYYSGAPFCTDLSGDPGHHQQSSSPRVEGSSSLIQEEPADTVDQGIEEVFPAVPRRTLSGSSLPYRPLSLPRQDLLEAVGAMGGGTSDLGTDMVVGEDGESDGDADEMACEFPWSRSPQAARVPRPLESTGLGGVLPDDHFLVTVSTKRAREEGEFDDVTNPEARFNSMVEQLGRLHTALPPQGYYYPVLPSRSPTKDIEYLSGRIKRLKPTSLPPPAIFFPPFSTDDSSCCAEELESSEADDERVTSSEEAASRRVHPHHQSDLLSLEDSKVSSEPAAEDDTGDAMLVDGESSETSRAGKAVAGAVAGSRSSFATAGGGPSGFSSSKEESDDSSD